MAYHFRLHALAFAASAVVAATSALSNDAQAWTLKTLHTFCSEAKCADGDRPLAGLLRDASGNLFGTTEVGGANDAGEVFELKRNGTARDFKVIYSFCSRARCSDGSSSAARLIMDTSGNLYGTTEFGGAFKCGTVFRLSPNTESRKWRLQTLHDFCDHTEDGQWSKTGLGYQGQASGALYDGASALFGTTTRGGAHGGGTVYELAPGADGKWKETVLHSFCVKADCTDGGWPLGDILVGGNAELFGTLAGGGAGDGGLAFQLTAASGKWREKVLYSFCQKENCADGGQPVGPLLQDASGALIGGGLLPGDAGVLYKLTPNRNRWTESVLFTFCPLFSCGVGYNPMGGVIMDASGHLFGTTELGGPTAPDAGVVFELSGKRYKVLYHFCSEQDTCSDGVFPTAPLIMDVSHNLYGTTSGGIGEQHGSVFELAP